MEMTVWRTGAWNLQIVKRLERWKKRRKKHFEQMPGRILGVFEDMHATWDGAEDVQGSHLNLDCGRLREIGPGEK
jgi:hypothetical protein